MKGLASTFALIAWFVFAMHPALAGQNEVLFRGIKPAYRIGEPIEFSVVSKSQRKIQFYCVAEGKVDGKWSELDYSIDSRPNSKAVLVRPLDAGHVEKLFWKPKNLPFGKPLVVRLKAQIVYFPGTNEVPGGFSATFIIR